MSNATDYARRLDYVAGSLYSKFPYDDRTNNKTMGCVDYEFPGNGDNSGQLRVSVGHISYAEEVTAYLEEIGAVNVKVCEVINSWGNYVIIKFDFPIENVPNSDFLQGCAYD